MEARPTGEHDDSDGPAAGRRPVPGVVGAERLSTRPLVAVLTVVTLVLLAVNLVAKLLTPVAERDASSVLAHLDVNHETNVPTMWNGALLVAVALACVAVAALRTGGRARWVVAALVASAMAADETLRVHERLGAVGAALSDGTGVEVPTYAWVLPGVVLALGLVGALLVWVRSLPGDVRWGVLAGGGMYVAGALGAEAVSGWIHQTHGVTLAYDVVTTLEEGLEMLGCVVVLAAVLGMVVVRTDDDGTRWAGLRV